VLDYGSPNLVTLRYRLESLNFGIAERSFKAGTQTIPAGSYIVDGKSYDRLKREVERLGLRATALSAQPDVPMHPAATPRIAIYSVWASAEMAGWADVFGKFGMDATEFGDFVHGGGVDFFLRVETGAHGPFMEKMEERAGFDEANRLCVGEKIESDFRRNAAVEEFVLGGPSVVHGAFKHFAGAGILFEELRRDEVWCARVG
jgi:hypothetical protein